MAVRHCPPPREPEDWLTDLGHLYFGGLPYDDLLHACSSAANELSTRRKRSAHQRYLLGQNIGNLLREIVSRASYSGAPGSMHWDVRHCHMSLAEAAANGLESEHRKARYYVMRWALRETYPDDPRPDQLGNEVMLFNGRREQMSILSHESDEAHAAVIAVLSQIHRDKTAGTM